jgi:predicted nucleic acid-binding protein
MLVVSNTSPISNLALIDRLDLLRQQFDELWIPEAVRRELELIPDPAAKTAAEQTAEKGWLRVRPVENRQLAALLEHELDRGEAAAIALSIEMKADLLLMDEREGRMMARRAGLHVIGVLGVLLRAKANGSIPSVKPELVALRNRAGFFVAERLEAETLRAAGE